MTDPADASAHFQTYRAAWPTRPADMSRARFDDELLAMNAADGRRMLTCSHDVKPVPTAPLEPGHQLQQAEISLWLVLADAVVHAPEIGAWGRQRQRGRLAHTNLSGGSEAHIGGEVTFGEAYVLMNGGSSRYRAREERELRMAAEAWALAGYHVFCMGWDEVGPSRVWSSTAWTLPAVTGGVL